MLAQAKKVVTATAHSNTAWLVAGYALVQVVFSICPDLLTDHPQIQTYVSDAWLLACGAFKAYTALAPASAPQPACKQQAKKAAHKR